LLLGEAIPDGGTDADTLFTDDVISFLLSEHGDPENCLAEGWSMKAAALANLVTTVEGSSQRKLSDLHDHALAQAKLFGAGGPSRTRIGRIKRAVRDHDDT
jgi:hypothetical protein